MEGERGGAEEGRKGEKNARRDRRRCLEWDFENKEKRKRKKKEKKERIEGACGYDMNGSLACSLAQHFQRLE